MINLKKEDMCNKSNVVSDDEHYNNEKIIDNEIGDNHAVNNLSECSSTPDDYERIYNDYINTDLKKANKIRLKIKLVQLIRITGIIGILLIGICGLVIGAFFKIVAFFEFEENINILPDLKMTDFKKMIVCTILIFFFLSILRQLMNYFKRY